MFEEFVAADAPVLSATVPPVLARAKPVPVPVSPGGGTYRDESVENPKTMPGSTRPAIPSPG